MKITKWIPTTDLMMLRRMGKLIEEISELSAVASRIIIQGIDEIDPSTGRVNKDRLIDEIADVVAQCETTVEVLKLPLHRIVDRIAVKKGYMREWEAMFENPVPPTEELPSENEIDDATIHG